VRRFLAFALACCAAPLAGQARRGSVRIENFYSPALGVRKHFVVYLPPAYDARSTRRYTVIYYLHGATGQESDWVAMGDIDLIADSLVARGMPEVLLVMPDGDDGWYSDAPADRGYAACDADSTQSHAAPTYCVEHSRYETYVAVDLVRHVDSTYRTRGDRAHRAIAGLSMGGYGAMAIALGHPDVFAAAASHSGVLSPLYAGPHPFVPPARYAANYDSLRAAWGNGFLWSTISPALGPDTAPWFARDPARRAARLVAAHTPVPALFIDVGAQDGLVDQSRAFSWELTRLGIPHAYAEWPGAHNWRYWYAHVGESLRWLAERIGK
jgi:S-formylglutathione hydrolase FrmB